MKRLTLVDFFIIFSLIALLLLALAFVKFTLFGGEEYNGKIVIRAKCMKYEFAECVSVGDKVFDCATGRQVGVISSLASEGATGGVRLTLTLDAVRRLRYTRAVRTPYVFIEAEEVCVYE